MEENQLTYNKAVSINENCNIRVGNLRMGQVSNAYKAKPPHKHREEGKPT